MTDVNNAALEAMSQAELDALAKEGNTTLFDGTLTSSYVVPKMQGGYKAMITGAREGAESFRGRVILVPVDSRARVIWTEGQTKLAMNAGLTEAQAKAWVVSRVPCKHVVLEKLATVMKNPDLVASYLDYNPEAEQQAVKDWCDKHRIHRDGLTHFKRAALHKLIKELQGPQGMGKLLAGLKDDIKTVQPPKAKPQQPKPNGNGKPQHKHNNKPKNNQQQNQGKKQHGQPKGTVIPQVNASQPKAPEVQPVVEAAPVEAHVDMTLSPIEQELYDLVNGKAADNASQSAEAEVTL